MRCLARAQCWPASSIPSRGRHARGPMSTRVGVPVCDTVEQYFERGGSADLAVVVSPLHCHVPQSIAALDAGAAVLCDKPLAVTLDEGLALVAARDRAQRPVWVGYQWSYSAAIQALKARPAGRDVRSPAAVRHALRLAPHARVLRSQLVGGQTARRRVGRARARQPGQQRDGPLPAQRLLPARARRPRRARCRRTSPRNCTGPMPSRARTRPPAARGWTTGARWSSSPHMPPPRRSRRVSASSARGRRDVRLDATRSSRPPALAERRRTTVIRMRRRSSPSSTSPSTACGHLAEPLCGVEAALAQTLCVKAMHDSVPDIVTCPSVAALDAGPMALVVVDGLGEVLLECFDAGRLPHESGLPWARAGAAATCASGRKGGRRDVARTRAPHGRVRQAAPAYRGRPGCCHGPKNAIRTRWPSLRREFPDDVVTAPQVYRTPLPAIVGSRYAKGLYIDEWGCRFDNIHGGVIGIVREPVIGDWSDLDVVPNAGRRPHRRPDAVNAFCRSTDQFVLAGTLVRPFERLGFIRTMEQALIDTGRAASGVRGAAAAHARTLPPGSGGLGPHRRRRDHDHGRLGHADGHAGASPAVPDSISSRCTRTTPPSPRRYGKYVFMHSDGNILAIMDDLIELRRPGPQQPGGVHGCRRTRDGVSGGASHSGASSTGRNCWRSARPRRRRRPFASSGSTCTRTAASSPSVSSARRAPENVLQVFRTFAGTGWSTLHDRKRTSDSRCCRPCLCRVRPPRRRAEPRPRRPPRRRTAVHSPMPGAHARYLEYARASADWTWDHRDETLATLEGDSSIRKGPFGYRPPGGLLETALIYSSLFERTGNRGLRRSRADDPDDLRRLPVRLPRMGGQEAPRLRPRRPRAAGLLRRDALPARVRHAAPDWGS